MGRRGEANHEKPRRRIPEPGDRTAPIRLRAERRASLLGHALPMGNEPRAAPASHHPLGEGLKRYLGILHSRVSPE